MTSLGSGEVTRTLSGTDGLSREEVLEQLMMFGPAVGAIRLRPGRLERGLLARLVQQEDGAGLGAALGPFLEAAEEIGPRGRTFPWAWARGPPQQNFLLDQTPPFDPTDAEPARPTLRVGALVFDQSPPDEFDD